MTKQRACLLPAIGLCLLTLRAIAAIVSGQVVSGQEPASIVINELEYNPNGSEPAGEWIELYNVSTTPIDLDGWQLYDNFAVDWLPAFILPPGGVAVVAASADFYDNYPTFTGTLYLLDSSIGNGLSNSGDRLILKDWTGVTVDALSFGADTSVFDCDGHPCAGVPEGYSLERDPAGVDTNTPADLVARQAPTPGRLVTSPPTADLYVGKIGPDWAAPGQIISYTILFHNQGAVAAAGVRLTDTLPIGAQLISQDAPYPMAQPRPGTLVWTIGSLPPAPDGAPPLSFHLATRLAASAAGQVTNVVTLTTVTRDANPLDNQAAATTWIDSLPAGPTILLDAVYYDGYAPYDHDEAVRLVNVGQDPIDLGGWSIGDARARALTGFPAGTFLGPGQAIWCTRQATAFEAQFGFPPSLETDDTDDTVPEMVGAWPGLANDGGECLLRDHRGQVVDVLVYENGDPRTPGWTGPAVWPWRSGGVFGAEGQILYRKRDQATGLPWLHPITQSLAAWAQDATDPLFGRRVLYPGWDLDQFSTPLRVTEPATLVVAIAPDHLLDAILTQLATAQHSIWIEAYTLESRPVANLLLDRLAAGVQVTVLLEGSPPGGVSSAQRWICDRLRRAGAGVWFMHSTAGPTRYRYQHAKVIVVDERLALIGTENLTPAAMPADDKANGTAGRRGIYLMTDAPSVVERIRAVMAADLDPAHHADLATCADVPDLCIGTVPPVESDWMTVTVDFPSPLVVHGEMSFEVVQSPENSLRTTDGLLGLLARAGTGDTVLVQQFYEHSAWGGDAATPDNDPNLRLDAYLAAARRGARVRVLLNQYTFDDYQNENVATVDYLRSAATGLDFQVRLGNPTALGLHNKMVLVHAGGQGTVHVGSINGSELSSKGNRELALQVQNDAAYNYLAALFAHDWATSPVSFYLPLAHKTTAWPAGRSWTGQLAHFVDVGHQPAPLLAVPPQHSPHQER